MSSQNISTIKPRVTVIIDNVGDTLVQFKASDARIILKDVLDKEVLDSIVKVYAVRDSIQNNTITLQVDVVKKLQKESENKDQLICNLNNMIKNKDGEILILNHVVKEQKKEIRKQKLLKIASFMGVVLLPILAIIIL